MNIVLKHTALVVFATVLCLHAFVVPTRGAEIMPNPMLEDADSTSRKPSSRQNARQRDGEARQLQRRESKGREQTLDMTRSRDERRQRDSDQTRFARPSRERGGSFQSNAAQSDRGERPRGIKTAMNAQDGSVPPDELLRLDEKKGKGDRRVRPEGEQREILRSEGEHKTRSRSGSTLNSQEGSGTSNKVLELNPQRQDRSRTETNGGKRDHSGTNPDGIRFGTSGNDDTKRGDHGPDKDKRDGDGIRFGTPGNDDKKRGDHGPDKDKRDGDGIRFGTSRGDDDGRRDIRPDHDKNRRDGDGFRFGTPGRVDDKRHDVRRNDRDHRRPHVVKHVIHNIPSRHAVIQHGRERYHYHSGRYYRPWEGGFILVRPPLGLIVLSIPFGSRIVVSAGIPYHVFGDVFYRRVPTGYEVVEPIRDRASNWPDQVTVVTDLLNVRYGPDDDEEVIAQVERYTVLNVLGSAPGWLYVEIEDEDVRGWVMERYVVAGAGRG